MEIVLKTAHLKCFLLVFFTSHLNVMKFLTKMDVILKGESWRERDINEIYDHKGNTGVSNNIH